MSDWRTSSYSSSGAQCVEVAAFPEAVKVRDTRNHDRRHLTIPTAEWTAFLTELKTSDL